MDRDIIVNAAIKRSAIKLFDIEKQITDDDFKALLEVARYSPSSFGLEPWKILVVNNKALREKISIHASGAQRQLSTASHFVIFSVTTDLEATSKYFKHISRDVKKLSDEAYQTFISTFSAFQTEKQNLTDTRKRTDWAGKQAYIALGNMMLAASLMGIDSCPIEGFIPASVEAVLADEGLLDLSSEHISVMAAFGYRQSDAGHEKARRSFEEIVRFV